MSSGLPYFYQYGVGGVVFAAGLYFGWRAGYVGITAGPKRNNLLLSLGGLAFFMLLQGWLQFVAPAAEHATQPLSPDVGSLERSTYGTSLDYGVMVGYFLAILALGSWFGRHNKSTKDFFFGGQRFSWWFIGMSMIATTVGSYSFVKYSRIAYTYGIASSQTYLNDWFWIPLFLFGWLPIIYFARISSIPEYFERRFGTGARLTVTLLLLVYLVGYIGVNLFTMGRALQILVGWPVLPAAILVATVSAIYVTWGGQTSVIVTDLFQGFMLLLAGVLLLGLGIAAVGGLDAFWTALPPGHRQAFPPFNRDAGYSAVGIFWQDAMANSAVFYFLNQGVIMRFLSARSLADGKRAAVSAAIILMPVAAMVVASGGWVGKAMEGSGLMPPGVEPDAVFFWVADALCRPGIFGVVMAALTAALMSTVDTLITAVAAIVVNDVWRPYLRPNRPDLYYLGVARKTSIAVTMIGVGLVPLFMQFDSIYSAHGAFTAAVTPPLVVALMLAVFWKRFTPAAAVATVVGGFLMVVLSIFLPELVEPFSHGVPRTKPDGTLLEYARAYKFTRALYGLAVSAVIGVVVTIFTKPKPASEIEGLVYDSIPDAAGAYEVRRSAATALAAKADVIDEQTGHSLIRVTLALQDALAAKPGDSVLISDRRWWYGGLRSRHGVISEEPADGEGAAVELGPDFRSMVASRSDNVVVEFAG